MRTLGLHLQQTIGLVDTPRPSTVAELDADGGLVRLEHLAADTEILAAIRDAPALIAVDAPLAIPNDHGQRDVERVLAWCDIPVFPISRHRLKQVHGGLRGVALAAAVDDAGVELIETSPDVVLRQLAWEDTSPGLLDLGEYRTRWIGERPPAYRPKGPGRAKPAGLVAARAVLARHVDLHGWVPAEDPDDWAAIRDAAAIDAIACAYAAWRAVHEPERVLRIGTRERGEMLLPVDGNLAARVAVNLERLRSGGDIAI